jgi:hypothetical protein
LREVGDARIPASERVRGKPVGEKAPEVPGGEGVSGLPVQPSTHGLGVGEGGPPGGTRTPVGHAPGPVRVGPTEGERPAGGVRGGERTTTGRGIVEKPEEAGVEAVGPTGQPAERSGEQLSESEPANLSVEDQKRRDQGEFTESVFLKSFLKRGGCSWQQLFDKFLGVAEKE